MIVVDTNVASELMRPSPAVAVREWVRGQDGIERLPGGRRKDALRAAVGEVFGMFAELILPFDAAAAEQYALVVSHRDGLGLPIEGFDAQIAAICRARGAALATRNLADFQETGVDVINPWQAGS